MAIKRTQPYTRLLSLTFDREMTDRIDAARGDLSPREFVEKAIDCFIKSQLPF